MDEMDDGSSSSVHDSCMRFSCRRQDSLFVPLQDIKFLSLSLSRSLPLFVILDNQDGHEEDDDDLRSRSRFFIPRTRNSFLEAKARRGGEKFGREREILQFLYNKRQNHLRIKEQNVLERKRER